MGYKKQLVLSKASQIMSKYLPLLVAIIFETFATLALKQSEQFTKVLPSVLSILGYIGAFYFLSISLKHIPLGVSYAIWSGIGIVLISLFGYLIYNQKLDLPAIIGIALILSGVILINVFSKTTA